eukprot:CAMPEP_0184495492 /NCGR_PEP_ID=MMETSP0113_2-20130426/31468_1 /TAXON_ID=91329 /ORGANISM="Norrisiella sphaerica, Strain BC52" /LENGTH=188 /DNA_ID=CAMNT_0026881697 /DNA_START=161 /DNA_END=727 /DNA_ORIENTATION=-
MSVKVAGSNPFASLYRPRLGPTKRKKIQPTITPPATNKDILLSQNRSPRLPIYKFEIFVLMSISSKPSGKSCPSSHGAISPFRGTRFFLPSSVAAEVDEDLRFFLFTFCFLKFDFSSSRRSSSSDIRDSVFSFSSTEAFTLSFMESDLLKDSSTPKLPSLLIRSLCVQDDEEPADESADRATCCERAL